MIPLYLLYGRTALLSYIRGIVYRHIGLSILNTKWEGAGLNPPLLYPYQGQQMNFQTLDENGESDGIYLT